jgi:glycosyltransferase involved in cell wall biosynthesis
MNKKLNVLFEGWINIPHSYAVVLCFKLIALYKMHKNDINFYIREMPYYNPAWTKMDLSKIYNKEYSEILNNREIFVEYIPNEHKIDLIYRITYPYNITVDNENMKIPKCVFYTSEFSTLDSTYFTVNKISEEPEKYIENFLTLIKNIYFTGPSNWSIQGLSRYKIRNERNKMITHGVDTNLFYVDRTNRSAQRKAFGIEDNEILLMNIGSMTGNKGILLILSALDKLINNNDNDNNNDNNNNSKKKYKLLLKGTADLYQSKLMLQNYLNILVNSGSISNVDNLLKHIVFTDQTISYEQIRSIYNAGDIYVSPYLAEGFNLTVLEAIACGINVIIPRTGSTKEYIEDLENNGLKSLVNYVDSVIIPEGPNRFRNDIQLENLVDVIKNGDFSLKNELDFKFLNEKYSWNAVSDQLYSYFLEILNK